MIKFLRALAASFLLVAAPAAAQEAVLSPPQALARDAGEYARLYAVTPDEALRRLRAQEESVSATDAIAARHRDRLVGISVEHVPDYRISVLLAGDQPVADEVIATGAMPVPVTYRVGAPATRARLVEASRVHQAAIRAMLRRPPGLGVDPREGTLVVLTNTGEMAAEGEDAFRRRVEALTGVPVSVRYADRIDADASVEGGARVVGVNPLDGRRYACTTGFVVTDGARDGVVTAAHCPDMLEHLDAARTPTPLEFVGQWGWSYQDVQLHLSDAPLRPYFFGDTAKAELRPVTGTRPRGSTRAGDLVCHRGETTGYSCAPVEFVDFAPSGDLCGGPCAPSWVTVAGPTCRSGDSGAPVFVGTTALGLVKGASYGPDRRCLFYYYMSTDYLPPGWRVVTGPPSARAREEEQVD